MAHRRDHFGDSSFGVFAQRKVVAAEKEFEFVGSVISGKVDAFVAEEVFFHLGKFLLRQIDLSENEGDLFGDEGEVFVKKVVVVKIFWGRGEGIEGKEVGGDDGEDHENVNSGGTHGCSSETGSAVAYFQRHGTHLFGLISQWELETKQKHSLH